VWFAVPNGWCVACVQNLPLHGKPGQAVRSEAAERKACAEAFKTAIADTIENKAGKKTLKVRAETCMLTGAALQCDLLQCIACVRTLQGAGNQPHELVSEFLGGIKTAEEKSMIEALWAALVAGIRAKGALKPSLALVDVSGSMTGYVYGSSDGVTVGTVGMSCGWSVCVVAALYRLPMQVAIALGLILAELSPDPWHGRMITFTETPQWFVVPNTMTSLEERVGAVQNMPWGMSTNFNAALELVLATAVANNTPQDAMPQAMIVVRRAQLGGGRMSSRMHVRVRVCIP
jgi:hypothetical protein